MNLYAYLPSLLSIFLVLISGVADKYLHHLIDTYPTDNQSVLAAKEVMFHVASDWSDRVTFINSMWVAIVSSFSIYASTKNFAAAGTCLVLLFIFAWMLYRIISHKAGDLSSDKIQYDRLGVSMSDSTLVRIVVVAVNLLLIAAIAITQLAAR